jgi:4-hydroxy-tetrahydrodipicolinate reductase
VIVNGFLGKLGSVIVRTAQALGSAQVAAGADIAPCPGPAAFPVFQRIDACDIPADVVLDASGPAGAAAALGWAQGRKLPLVVCTTGLPDATERQIVKAASEIPIFKSANLSLGINLLLSFLRKYAAVLDGAGFDIEIVEKHHNQKIDAPSGTALMLADAANDAVSNRFGYVVDRTSRQARRTRNEIGVHSLRGGSIVGEHTVVFAGRDEVIEVTHIAQSKELFAVGALRAAEYLLGKGPGLYTMRDLMGD